MIKGAGLALVASGALMMLSGCASMLDSAWDDAAHEDCERETSPGDRLSCHDRVDDISRERDRGD